jgi:hypothetical protein
MLRHVAWAVLFLAAGVLGAGCFGGGEVALPNGAECDFDSFEGNGKEPICEGGLCLFLLDNVQGVVGMCSQTCGSDSDCNPHEGCEATSDGSGPFCLRRCHTDGDCYDRFVCRLIGVGNPDRYCIVDPL